MSPEELKADLARRRERQRKAVETSQNGQNAAQEPRQRAEPEPRRPTQRQERGNGPSPDIQRALPHAVEAEQGVLGSMLISPRDTIAEVVARISSDYFYIPSHQTIYTALVEIWDAGQGIDLITFTQHLRDVGQLDQVGGPSFITSLFTFVPTAANIGYYLEIVRDKYLLRQTIAACTEGARRSYEEQDEVDSLIDEVEQKILSIRSTQTTTELASMKENVMHSLDVIEQAFERKGGVTGVATGFVEFDRMTGGLQRSEMIVIAARPSMGKTALVMNIAEHVAVFSKLPVAIFSLEMSREQLTARMLCSRARVNMSKVRDGFLQDQDFTRLTTAGAALSEAPIYIDDASGLKILDLRARARRLKVKHDIQLIVIDYLQLLRGSGGRRDDNRQVEVTEISGGLKGLAKELGIPILVAAQLNRNPENRTGYNRGRPRLSDLRESGSIEQDADLVGLLVRQEYYADTEEEKDEVEGKADLIIAKARNGPTGDIALTFRKEFTRFDDRARDEREPL